VLARHPDAGFVSNLEDRTRLGALTRPWNNAAYRLLPQSATQKGRMRFAPSEAYRALDREVSPVLSRPWRDLTAADITPWLSSRTRAFFDRRAAAQGLPVFLHKFTGWPRAGFLGCVFPEAKFVHVVRDGRAVANSWLQMGWWEGFNGPDHWQWGPLADGYAQEWTRSGHSFPVLAGILWKLLLDAFDAAQAALPADRWLEVRYEDVVANPTGAFNEMREFAGLKPNTAFSRAVERMAFNQGRTDAYRKDLGDETVAVLTRSLASHLAKRGYAV
jgi:Sulfotransferase family